MSRRVHDLPCGAVMFARGEDQAMLAILVARPGDELLPYWGRTSAYAVVRASALRADWENECRPGFFYFSTIHAAASSLTRTEQERLGVR